jgi:hypothetical protein
MRATRKSSSKSWMTTLVLKTCEDWGSPYDLRKPHGSTRLPIDIGLTWSRYQEFSGKYI